MVNVSEAMAKMELQAVVGPNMNFEDVPKPVEIACRTKKELEKTLRYVQEQMGDPVVSVKLMEYIANLESERDLAQEEYQSTFGKLERVDADLESHKHWLKVAGGEIEKYKNENKHLWALIGIKAAEMNV
ncbi:hypothetical protein [Mesobacillus zeae]|uniref:Uncharacterized protein n=1 Tax=Mesobacillus zeae TaxID=1917180 RepID=A0A398B9X6_9BACI|nr:hypothetical protein [Mesobacillus zeae]RID85648.1 hypothetical protein D1970_08825 [Mesobacillus zeae]